jgi:alkylation response protein AidB-like acyl-CoA dehydrogenase
MKLDFSLEDKTFEEELLFFLEQHCPPEARTTRDMIGSDDVDAQGVMVIPEWAKKWQATLFDHGWMIPSYPKELGGRDASSTQTLLYLEAMAQRGICRSLHFGGYAIVAPSLLEFGNDAQKTLVPAAIRGDTVWCVGMSEPGAGSDLASLATRAEDKGDHFRVSGQKVWTSYAMVASKCFCYVRTDTDLPKHRGISLLIVDMDAQGVKVRPLRHLTGQAEFAEVFFDEVKVPRENLVGELNGGWQITMGSLAHERGGLWVEGVAGCLRAVDDIVAMVKRLDLQNDASITTRVAKLYSQTRSLRAMGWKGFASFSQGSGAPEHSYMKIATSELQQTLYELGMDLQGSGLAITDPKVAQEEGRWQRAFLDSLAATIGGGTSEIQRNVIARQVLGLPRD